MAEQAAQSGLSQMLEELRGDLPRIELSGNRRVLIENHRGILECEETRLRVRCSGMEIVLEGRELCLAALSQEELAVTGILSSVTLREGEGV